MDIALVSEPSTSSLWWPNCIVCNWSCLVVVFQLIINPRKAMDKADLSVNNPLSQEEEVCHKLNILSSTHEFINHTWKLIIDMKTSGNLS